MLVTRSLCACVGALSLCLPLGVLAADAPATPKPRPLRLDFEGDQLPEGWAALDGEAALALTHEPEHVASGKGALEFRYHARQGVFEQMGLSGLTVQAASSLSLKVQAAFPTSLLLGVQERSGAMYQGLLWIPGGQWVAVRTRLDDLTLAESSTDSDGRLKGSDVSGLFLADLANLAGEVGRALGQKEGEQRLWLDDLAFSEDSAPARGRVERLGDEWLTVVEDFESEVIWALPIGDAGLKLVPGAPKAPGRQGLEVTYALGSGHWVGFVTAPPGRLDRAGATKLRLRTRSALRLQFVVVLEHRDGSKYQVRLRVPADDKWHEGVVPLADFVAEDDVADTKARLDPGRVHRVIILVDTFDADVRANGTGSVAFDDLGFVAPTAPKTAPEP